MFVTLFGLCRNQLFVCYFYKNKLSFRKITLISIHFGVSRDEKEEEKEEQRQEKEQQEQPQQRQRQTDNGSKCVGRKTKSGDEDLFGSGRKAESPLHFPRRKRNGRGIRFEEL